ncbi:hypothetical protein [Streptomyces sp. MZ04]|uniref:hypothetical protein n=1 Tax=Streptomyces sp. MZ04 TaxID=2559236 RepID=UPI00107E82F5|nr:hypothetical protein [Streptomyces sp. MZ04]TGB11597.1 hypothetical protein E2651_13030 [Streptomyces sp. MZ04]
MTARLSPERETEIRNRAEAATPGPWVEYADYGKDFYAYTGGPYLRGVGTLNLGDGEDADADREFITHAAEDVPALLAELAAARAERVEARKRVDELEKVAVEARAALGSLCYDLEDPGSNALGALYLLSQATTWTATKPDDALRVLAKRDATVREAALREAEGVASELFDAADERGDRAGAEVAEQIADRMARIADGTEAGGQA